MSSTGADNGPTNWHKDIYNRWTPTNTNTDVPRIQLDYKDANQPSSRFITSASYFNLRNITLGYTFPKDWVKKLDIERVRLYVVVDNVALFSARKGLDPRQNFTGTTDYAFSPIRTASIGLSVNF
jgi:hypothetical protein